MTSSRSLNNLLTVRISKLHIHPTMRNLGRALGIYVLPRRHFCFFSTLHNNIRVSFKTGPGNVYEARIKYPGQRNMTQKTTPAIHAKVCLPSRKAVMNYHGQNCYLEQSYFKKGAGYIRALSRTIPLLTPSAIKFKTGECHYHVWKSRKSWIGQDDDRKRFQGLSCESVWLTLKRT
jgi:hypothetical protein